MSKLTMPHSTLKSALAAALLAVVAAAGLPEASADETCNSPFMSNLIKGQEDFVYVWTLGVEGVGDGSDKLVTIDVNPVSARYGKVIHSTSVLRRGEAHHMGFTEDRRFLWAGGLDDSKIYIFDVYSNPAKPRLVRTLDDLPGTTGLVGPHTFYAMPGRMLVQDLTPPWVRSELVKMGYTLQFGERTSGPITAVPQFSITTPSSPHTACAKTRKSV